MRVATALSESSSIHSDGLYHLTKDVSRMELEPISYSILEPVPYNEEPSAVEQQRLLKVTTKESVRLGQTKQNILKCCFEPAHTYWEELVEKK